MSKHSVFFTESPDEDTLQRASSAIFCSWYAGNLTFNGADTLSRAKEPNSRDLGELVVSAIDRLMTGGIDHEHDTFTQITPREMRARKRGKLLFSVNQTERRDGPTTTFLDQSETSIQSITTDPPMLDIDQAECQRTLTHPLHTISTGPTPLPIEQWPPLQDPENKPSNMMRVPKEEMKENLPHDLIVFRDANGRQRILVPKCQRIALRAVAPITRPGGQAIKYDTRPKGRIKEKHASRSHCIS
jgi:hypothetical protein